MYYKVKAIAKEKGMSIKALEKAAGLSNGTIGKWQKSTSGVGRLGSIRAIANALGVTVEELIKEEGA